MPKFWPLSSDYADAVQMPDVCCADPELKTSKVTTLANGLPRPPCAGNFADVYQFRSQDGQKLWEVKCFTRRIARLAERYREISQQLEAARLPFTVAFKYLEQGMLIRGEWFPVLKMDWVEGLTLRQFVEQNLQKPRMLNVLFQIWLKVEPLLRQAGVAHGDLQYGNVMLVPGSSEGKLALRLIDYDGMWVPSLAGQPPGEVGHPSFQHPQRAKQNIYSPAIDRFPHLVIACALNCLGRKEGPALWKKFDNGDNLLFRQSDFESPATSPVLHELWETGDAELQAWVAHLAIASQAPLEETPDAEHLCLDGHIQPLIGDVEQRARQVLGVSPKRGIVRVVTSQALMKSTAEKLLLVLARFEPFWKNKGQMAVVAGGIAAAFLLLGITLFVLTPSDAESLSSDKAASTTIDPPGANAVNPPVTPDSSKDPQLAQLDPATSNKPRNVRAAAPKELPEIEPEPAPAKPVKPLPAPPQSAEAVNKPAVEPEKTPLVKVLPAQKLARVSKDGILLRFDSEARDFFVLPRGAELKTGDRLASPEPFRADLAVGDDLCMVALNGGTAVRMLGPDEHAGLGFDVEQGALLFEARGLRSAEADSNAAKPQKPSLPITLLLHGDRTRLELASDDAVCGLEVHRHEPTRFETDLNPPNFTASLYVARGSIRFINIDGKATTIEGPGFLPITADATANVKNGEIGRASQLVLPDWLETDPKRAAAKLKRPWNTAFEKEFDAEHPLLTGMPAVVSNPRPAISELAVKCLALTDSHEPLVKVLSRGDHREARLVAITGLRQWLPLDPRNRVLLKAELSKHFLPSDADAVYRLLWGFDQSDAKTPITSRTLVGWLESENLPIRELAFFHVQRLTGLKHEYSPVNPPGQRRAAVERWYSHLEKKGGALVQE